MYYAYSFGMGLDIVAYSKLEFIGRHPGMDAEDHEYDPKTGARVHVEAFAYSDFSHALAGVPGERFVPDWGSGSPEIISAGCFAVTPETQTHDFQAGSYHGYGRWREELATCFGWKRDTEDPFMELIYFADNEGTLCAQAAAELLKDFEAGREQWTAYWAAKDGPLDTYRMAKYEDWTLACRLAADGGLIDFH